MGFIKGVVGVKGLENVYLLFQYLFFSVVGELSWLWVWGRVVGVIVVVVLLWELGGL